MKRPIIFGLGIALIGVIAPTMAISQNPALSMCDELNTLRHESVGALFVHFQGSDDLETATKLLRQTLPNGSLIPQVAARFDMASIALANDPVQSARKARISELQSYPMARKCPSLQDTDIMWGAEAL